MYEYSETTTVLTTYTTYNQCLNYCLVIFSGPLNPGEPKSKPTFITILYLPGEPSPTYPKTNSFQSFVRYNISG